MPRLLMAFGCVKRLRYRYENSNMKDLEEQLIAANERWLPFQNHCDGWRVFNGWFCGTFR